MVEKFNYEKEIEQARQQALRVYQAAEDHYEELIAKREAIDKQILKVRQDMEEFAHVAGVRVDDPNAQFGLTDSIRYILGTSRVPMPASEIVWSLQRASYIAVTDDPLPSVLTVLRRLIKAGEVEMMSGANNSYKWIGGLPPTPPAPKRNIGAIHAAILSEQTGTPLPLMMAEEEKKRKSGTLRRALERVKPEDKEK